jgi:hypothetical protein
VAGFTAGHNRPPTKGIVQPCDFVTPQSSTRGAIHVYSTYATNSSESFLLLQCYSPANYQMPCKSQLKSTQKAETDLNRSTVRLQKKSRRRSHHPICETEIRAVSSQLANLYVRNALCAIGGTVRGTNDTLHQVVFAWCCISRRCFVVLVDTCQWAKQHRQSNMRNARKRARNRSSSQ